MVIPTKTQRLIKDVMTRAPRSIAKGETLAQAHRLMRAHRIRHLPVMDRGELVGLISQRDLYFLETLRDMNPDVDCVEEAMSRDAYVVRPSTPLEVVCRAMVRRRLGCAVVMSDGKLRGIFTLVDAAKVLAKLSAQP